MDRGAEGGRRWNGLFGWEMRGASEEEMGEEAGEVVRKLLP